MATIAGLGTTFNLPNYGGEILTVTPSETPLLTAIGGLNEQGESADDYEFGWQTQALGAPADTAHLEGADAPADSEDDRAQVTNVCQIFQYAFGVSYTRQAAIGRMSGSMNNSQTNPVTDEIANQTRLKLIQAARDINHVFMNGAYAKPASNASARKTRGLLAAITTNVTDNLAAALTKLQVLDMVQSVWNTHGFNQDAEPTLICGATLKRGLTKLFVTDAGYKEETRTVGGVNVQTIVTDFGNLNIMLERTIPATTLAFAHLAMLRPRYLVIPDKGFLFVEELAKTGAKTRYQLYGEVGLEYGADTAHAKIINAGAVAGA